MSLRQSSVPADHTIQQITKYTTMTTSYMEKQMIEAKTYFLRVQYTRLRINVSDRG